jgi:hypothetical protein
LVDTGIDWTHPDFRTDRDGDGFEESSRILWLWDQTETGAFGSPRKVPFGTEYTREEIEAALRSGVNIVNERDESGHGTHVTGIAVGDGSASGGTFVGMAPNAEMILVKTSYFSTDIVEGVRYVFEKASWLGKPAVVNLSLGGHFGPHDGTSLFEQGLEAFLGQPGRAIVASAGNDGDQNIHLGGQLRPREAFTFTFVPNEETAYVNIWYSGSANFTVSVTSPGINGPPQTVLAVRGQGEFQNTPDGSVEIDNSRDGLDPRNRDRAVALSLERVQPGSAWQITLTDQGGTGGRFDAWPGLSTMGYFPQGDSFSTVTEPATAKKHYRCGGVHDKSLLAGGRRRAPSVHGCCERGATCALLCQRTHPRRASQARSDRPRSGDRLGTGQRFRSLAERKARLAGEGLCSHAGDIYGRAARGGGGRAAVAGSAPSLCRRSPRAAEGDSPSGRVHHERPGDSVGGGEAPGRPRLRDLGVTRTAQRRSPGAQARPQPRMALCDLLLLDCRDAEHRRAENL